jgi:hypothetical protein
MNINIIKLNAVVAEAKRKAPQMATQIDKAADALLCNPFINDQDGGLLILSSSDKTDNIYYTRGGKCNCRASEFNRVCWHRIADRLVRLYNARAGH